MRAALIALTLTVLWNFSEGTASTWQNLKREPEQWKCLPPEGACQSNTEPLSCCSGHCCSDGRCKPCFGAESSASGKPTASLESTVFTDFLGRRFEFAGVPGEVYSLVTEADHQLNALLGPGGQALELGVTLRGVGIHGPDTSVRLSTSPEGRLIVEINERPFRGTRMRLDGVTISAGCTVPDSGDHESEDSGATVADGFMNLSSWVASVPGQDPELNFRIELGAAPLSQVHGILGQTLEGQGSFVAAAPRTQVALPANLQFYGEGQPSDYSTTDLFSADSTFSVFTRKLGRRRHRRKRSVLEGNALAALALASRGQNSARQSSRPHS